VKSFQNAFFLFFILLFSDSLISLCVLAHVVKSEPCIYPEVAIVMLQKKHLLSYDFYVSISMFS